MSRVPAHDRDSERQLIGSCMLVRSIATDLVGTVDEADFYVDAHRLAWAALTACEREGLVADTEELAKRLKAAGALERVGGYDFLDGLTAVIPTIANAEAHAKRIRQLAAVRAMGAAAALVHDESYAVDDAAGYLARAERVIAEAAARLSPDREPVTLGQASEKSIERLVARQSGKLDDGAPIPSGLRTVDWILGGGFWPGRLYVIAGRPGMGKSALGQTHAIAAGKRGPVLIQSLEMPDEELGDRALSVDSQIDGERLRAGKLSRDDMERLFASSTRLHNANVWIDDTAGTSISHIRRVARRHKRKRGLVMLVVDYLQLMRGERRSDNREQEVAEISRGLKALAKELACPVLALSQLNRKCEDRADKRPQTGDLRESGSIEQDADCILFVYRDEVYNPGTQDAGIAEVIVAKQRGGRTGTVRLHFRKELTAFFDIEEYR